MNIYATNTCKHTPRGVNLKTGATVYLMPGERHGPMEIDDVEYAAMKKHAAWFVIEATDDNPEPKPQPSPADVGKVVTPQPPELTENERIIQAAMAGADDHVIDPLASVKPNFAEMSDDALRGYLTDAGVKFHPATGHDKLAAKAGQTYDALAADQQPDLDLDDDEGGQAPAEEIV